MGLVSFLASNVYAALGMDPMTGERLPRREPAAARQMIDWLGVLEQKTRGNLSFEESDLLAKVLYELRLAYVEAVRPPAGSRRDRPRQNAFSAGRAALGQVRGHRTGRGRPACRRPSFSRRLPLPLRKASLALPPPVTRSLYRSQWFEFLSAFSENDAPEATRAIDEMVRAARKVGVHHLSDFSRTAVFLGRRAENLGQTDRAATGVRGRSPARPRPTPTPSWPRCRSRCAGAASSRRFASCRRRSSGSFRPTSHT